MDEVLARRTRVHRLAWACAVLVLAITSLSAFIRLSRAGLGCEPWPQCHVQRAGMTAERLEALDAPVVTAARIAHRVVASAALLLVIALLMVTLRQQPALWSEGRIALALLALALFLAVLGRMGGASRAPAVALGNLLGGFAMFAVSVRLLAGSAGRAPVLRRWTLAAIALLVLQVASGGLVSVQQAGSGCTQSSLCRWHVAGAAAVVVLLLPLALLAWRHGRRRLGAAIAGLVLLQPALGLLLPALGLPMALALAHNVTAALMLAALLALLPPR
jgi:heme a synthase